MNTVPSREIEWRRDAKNSTLFPGDPAVRGGCGHPSDPTTNPGGAQVIGGRPSTASGLQERTAAGPPGPSGLAWLTIAYIGLYVG